MSKSFCSLLLVFEKGCKSWHLPILICIIWENLGLGKARGGQLASISLESRLAARGSLFGETKSPHLARTDVTVEIMLHFFFSPDLDGLSLNEPWFGLDVVFSQWG